MRVDKANPRPTTMRIRLTTECVRFGHIHHIDDEVDWPIDEARRFVTARLAEPVTTKTKSA